MPGKRNFNAVCTFPIRESGFTNNKKAKAKFPLLWLLAGDEGFEPPQTESESGVLPLHKSPVPKRKYYYTEEMTIVKEFFYTVSQDCRMEAFLLW